MTALRICTALLLSGIPAAAHAQAVVGNVLEESTRAPLGGVAIDAVRNGTLVATALSDSTGAFVLRLDAPGRYVLRVSHPSYAASTASVDVAGRQTVAVELMLSRVGIPLRPLIVRTERDPRITGFNERMARSPSGQFLTRAQIETRPAARTTDLLREMRGVEILQVSTGLGRPRVHLISMNRGVGRCAPTIYIDGISVGQFPDSGVDDFLRPDMLHGAEVYTNAASAPSPIEARDGCGVVAFWTRPVEDVEAWSLRRLLTGAGALAGMALLVLLTR